MSGIFVLVLTLAGLLLVLGMVVGARLLDAHAWRQGLVGFELRLPLDVSTESVTQWLSALAALTHAPRGTLLPQPPVVVEVVASDQGVRYYLFTPEAMEGAVLASLRSSLPGVRLTAIGAPKRQGTTYLRIAAELRLSGRLRQLAIERAEQTARAMLAALQPLGAGSEIRWQFIVTGAGTPAPLPASGRHVARSAWLTSSTPAPADELQAARLKHRLPLLHACGRLVVAGSSRAAIFGIFGRAWGSVRLLNLPGARLVRRLLPSWLVGDHADRLAIPVFGWPLLLNAAELAGLLPFPVGETPLPGVPLGMARQVAPPIELPVTGTILADATYPGLERPLAISAADRLMHMSVVGPTGTGKSTLMVNAVLQDANRGDGFAVLDPKADMAFDIMQRLPQNRWDDVVIVNPRDSDRPVGFNVLANDGSEAGRELAADHVLHVFHEQWKEFWGPRTDAILRAGLLVLTSTKAPDGSAFTVCELPALLTNESFRRFVLAQPSVPFAVREFWDWFIKLSRAEQTQVVGPVLNKLTALTQRTPLRLMLGQSQGIDLADAMQTGKILLMPLSRGLIGTETAALLSSLMLSSLWQTALGRVRTPKDKRRPFWLYIDEAAEVVRLPLDLADMMGEARGLGLGLTLAMQHLSQLPADVRSAMLATVRSQVVFQIDDPADAAVLAKSFAPTMNADDLRSLAAHEVALRLSAAGRTLRPTTGVTRPLPEVTNDGAKLRASSREQYGVSRPDVEAAMIARLQTPRSAASSTEYGKRPRGDRRSS